MPLADTVTLISDIIEAEGTRSVWRRYTIKIHCIGIKRRRGPVTPENNVKLSMAGTVTLASYVQ